VRSTFPRLAAPGPGRTKCHAGIDLSAQGRVVTDWLRQEDAAGIIQAADGFNAEFGLLLRFLLFTGLRIGEVLAIRWSDIDLESGTVWVTREKDGVASDVRMRDDLRAQMARHGPQEPHRRVFRFHRGGGP
jgi:integrase